MKNLGSSQGVLELSHGTESKNRLGPGELYERRQER